MFLTQLTAELVDEGKNPQGRTAAGIILKNELSSQVLTTPVCTSFPTELINLQNEVKQKACEDNWLKLDPPLRENIKNGVCLSLL